VFDKGFELNEESLRFVEDLGRYVPGGFFIYEAAQPEELLYANQAVFDIFGCKDQEEFAALTGKTFKGMVYPEDYAKIEADIDEQIASSGGSLDHVEYRITRKDGEIRWVDDYGHRANTEAHGDVYFVFISDITEERARHNEDFEIRGAIIETLTNTYNTVWLIKNVETEECALYYTDMDKAHEEAIRNALSHAKYTDTKTEYVNTMVAEEDRERMQEQISLPYILKQFETRDQFSVDFLRTLEEESRYYRIVFGKVNMPGGHTGVTMGFRDVDREVRQEREFQRDLLEAREAAEQASKAKTVFLANMSHEIRTPMNAIIGLNDIAMNDPATPEATKEHLRKIDASAKHLLTIINDILDMSRIESGRMVIKSEEFSFAKTIEQINTIISGQCHDKGLHYGCYIEGPVDDYYIGDDMKLRQVMINILGNAVKFTKSGGAVTMTIEETARMDGKASLRFVFKDTGIGMSREYLPKIFDTFSQENADAGDPLGSTGLGMPITKNIVELMNGTIEVESEQGVGTTFTVTVPVGLSPRGMADHGDGEIDLSHLNVLVIDDDKIACEHARIVLAQAGIDCETALSGSDALEMISVHHTRREDFDLILVDWKMPDLDGLETTRRIREIVGEDTPIIILTSYHWDDVADEATEAGVDSFVPKPLFANTVLEEFKKAFEKKNRMLLASKADLTGRRILLAEDVVINAEIMLMVLEAREIEVDLAENGKIALDKFVAAGPGHYDAILMDMRMPVMDGIEATKAIRAAGCEDSKTIPIIALTANAFDEDVQRSMQAGLNAHLSKPVDPAILFDTLENLIQ